MALIPFAILKGRVLLSSSRAVLCNVRRLTVTVNRLRKTKTAKMVLLLPKAPRRRSAAVPRKMLTKTTALPNLPPRNLELRERKPRSKKATMVAKSRLQKR